MTYNQIMKKIQTGGGKLVEHKFRYKDRTYTVLVNKGKTYDDEIEYTIVQQVKNSINKPECVRGEINDNTLYISSVRKFKACVSPTIDSHQGIALTRFLIRLIKKEYPHVNRVELTDYASINCTDRERTRLNLSDVMLLTHGHSYYALVGMKPKKLSDAEYYKKVKRIVATTTWDAGVLRSLLRNKTVTLPAVGTPFHEAMKYMFKEYCDDMATAIDSYMQALGIPRSLFGFEYLKHI